MTHHHHQAQLKTNQTLPKLNLKHNESSTQNDEHDSSELEKVSHRVQPEPWQIDYGDSTTMKQQRAIRHQISYMTEGQQEEAKQPNLVEVDASKIVKKMKKYQPANSSFSLLYGEKKQSEVRHAKAMPFQLRKMFNLPTLNLRGQHVQERSRPKCGIFSQRKDQRINSGEKKTEMQSYLSQIKCIYRQGCVLRQRSQILIGKIDRMNDYMSHKYEQLSSRTDEMIEDVGNYHLEEQTNKNYKNTLEPIPYKLRR